jgi:hypothetical protein
VGGAEERACIESGALTRARAQIDLRKHRSDIGEFFLSSDSVVPTFTTWGFAAEHPDLVTEDENNAFETISYTIGGMMVFPGNPINGKWTINQARGCLSTISDRFDLTLECIRRHYMGQPSPLGETLARYRDFFALFETFSEYTDFFLLQDLITRDCTAVTIFPPFDDVKTRPVPKDLETYREYRRQTVAFIEARNRRIARSATAPR